MHSSTTVQQFSNGAGAPQIEKSMRSEDQIWSDRFFKGWIKGFSWTAVVQEVDPEVVGNTMEQMEFFFESPNFFVGESTSIRIHQLC